MAFICALCGEGYSPPPPRLLADVMLCLLSGRTPQRAFSHIFHTCVNSLHCCSERLLGPQVMLWEAQIITFFKLVSFGAVRELLDLAPPLFVRQFDNHVMHRGLKDDGYVSVPRPPLFQTVAAPV